MVINKIFPSVSTVKKPYFLVHFQFSGQNSEDALLASGGVQDVNANCREGQEGKQQLVCHYVIL